MVEATGLDVVKRLSEAVKQELEAIVKDIAESLETKEVRWNDLTILMKKYDIPTFYVRARYEEYLKAKGFADRTIRDKTPSELKDKSKVRNPVLRQKSAANDSTNDLEDKYRKPNIPRPPPPKVVKEITVYFDPELVDYAELISLIRGREYVFRLRIDVEKGKVTDADIVGRKAIPRIKEI